MKTVDIRSFKNTTAIVRVDFNVPLDKQNKVTDDTRIRAALPTIQKILSDGGAVVLMSHLGRPLKKLNEDGTLNIEKFTLRHVVPTLEKLLNKPVKFVADCVSDEALAMSSSLQAGEVLLLENLRFHKAEEKGDLDFAKRLATHGQIYVNDAFGTAHRAHASTTQIAQYFTEENKVFGKLMAAEVSNAARVLKASEAPFAAIIGGAKVSDKILIIENLLDRANFILIGGGMSYTFLKALGHPIGKSLCEEDKLELALDVLAKAKAKGVQVLLPIDHVVADSFSNEASFKTIAITENSGDNMGLDLGIESIKMYTNVILKSRTILWNGPMGVFEMPNFQKGTVAIAQAVAQATKAGAFSLVGGGDSVAAVTQFGLEKEVSFVSTGGGALLAYFEGKTLPGINALISNN